MFQHFRQFDAQISFKHLQKYLPQSDVPVVVFSENAPQELAIFRDCTFIRAAGGVVRCPQQKFLFIHRLGKWDLPKGKLEVGEQPEQGAVREVAEECSVPEPKIIGSLPPTYHTYPYKNGHALKRTDWYLMELSECHALTPQTEEDITDARWLTINEVGQICLPNTYPAIVDVWLSALD